jgi:hypothetical protein
VHDTTKKDIASANPMSQILVWSLNLVSRVIKRMLHLVVNRRIFHNSRLPFAGNRRKGACSFFVF